MPSFHGLLGYFWDTEIIGPRTINSISTPYLGPVPFILIIYGIAIAAFVILRLLRKPPSALRRVVYALLIAGALFAVRMDYNWLKNFIEDWKFGRDPVETRVARFMGGEFFSFGDYYGFLMFAKGALPEGATLIYLTDEETRTRIIDGDYRGLRVKDLLDFSKEMIARYYLLPVRTSEKGSFALVHDDPEAVYSPDTGVLRVRGRAFSAREHAVWREGASVYEIMGEAR